MPHPCAASSRMGGIPQKAHTRTNHHLASLGIRLRPRPCISHNQQAMETQGILVTLRQHAPELQAAGVAHLHLFGSVARGEATAASDVDLLADFQPGYRISLLTLSSLQSRLSAILGTAVDLSSPAWLKEPARDRALKESLLAF